MAAIPQAQPAAVRCAPHVALPPAPQAASERDQRCLKLLASVDRVPPVLEKDSRRRLVLEDAPYRFGTVMAKGERRILVPPSGAVQRRPKLMVIETLLALRYDETGGPLPEFEPAWQSETVWDSEETLPVAMDFGEYLEDYTPDQPWQDWDWDALLEEAKYFQTLTDQRERQRDQLRSLKAQDGVATAGAVTGASPRPPVHARPRVAGADANPGGSARAKPRTRRTRWSTWKPAGAPAGAAAGGCSRYRARRDSGPIDAVLFRDDRASPCFGRFGPNGG